MKKFLVSIIAISVATGAMAASTLVSSGENKSAPSATYRAGSLRANKGVTESVITTPAAKNQEIGRIGTISTKKITVSSNKNTGGTTGGTQTGGSSSNNTNAGAMTNAAIQQQLDAFSLRIDRAYDAASLAADSVVSAQNVINGMRDDLEDVKNHITSLQGDSDTNITELVSRIETLQRNLNGLEGNLNTLSANTVALNTFTQQVGTLNQKIEDVKGTTEQLTNAGYLTPASISDLTSRVDNAIATIGTMQETLATKVDIANMATQQYVNDAKQAAMNYADEAKAVANSYTDIKVSSSIGSNNEAIKQYVDAKVGTGDSVSAKDYIDTTIAAKVGEIVPYASAKAYTDAAKAGANAYTNTKTNDMKTYVDGRIGFDEGTGRTLLGITGSVPTVKEYVDGKDTNVRNWVSDNVVGPIQNATVKAYIDGKFDDAADPENPNGWGSHFKEVNNGLLALGAEYQSDKQQNNENNENATSRITALEQGQEQTNENLRAETERLDGRVESMKGYFNGLNTSFNALNADAVKKSTFNDELITANAYNTLKNNVEANYVRNDALNNKLKETDAYVALSSSVEAIPDTYMTKEAENNLKSLITANTNQINLKMNSADFATQLAADTEFQKLQTDLTNAATKAELNDAKADIADTYASKTAVTKLQEDMTAANNAIATKVSNEDLTTAINSAVTAAFAEGGAGYNLIQSQTAQVVATTCPAGGK